MTKQVSLFVSLLFLLVNTALAQDKYRVEDYQVVFFINNAGITVEGSMQGLEAITQFHSRKPSKIHISASLDPATIDTGIGIRDNHLKRSDYFDVEQYPRIILESTGFEKVGKDKLIGTFTLIIKDVREDLEIPITFTEEGDQLKLSCSFTINRLNFNLGEESLILSDEVEVQLSARLSQL